MSQLRSFSHRSDYCTRFLSFSLLLFFLHLTLLTEHPSFPHQNDLLPLTAPCSLCLYGPLEKGSEGKVKSQTSGLKQI